MPEDSGRVMDKAFPAPVQLANWHQPHCFMFGRQVKGYQLVPKAPDVIHLQKDYRIVHPVPDIRILNHRFSSLQIVMESNLTTKIKVLSHTESFPVRRPSF